jgi:hypothetical protein
MLRTDKHRARCQAMLSHEHKFEPQYGDQWWINHRDDRRNGLPVNAVMLNSHNHYTAVSGLGNERLREANRQLANLNPGTGGGIWEFNYQRYANSPHTVVWVDWKDKRWASSPENDQGKQVIIDLTYFLYKWNYRRDKNDDIVPLDKAFKQWVNDQQIKKNEPLAKKYKFPGFLPPSK